MSENRPCVKILAVKCPQVAVIFGKYGRELLPPPGNTAEGGYSGWGRRQINTALIKQGQTECKVGVVHKYRYILMINRTIESKMRQKTKSVHRARCKLIL
jgi:hypothetical protein